MTARQKHMHVTLRKLLLPLVTLAIHAGSAHPDGLVIEEVVVQAQKRVEPVLEVPLSVSYRGGKEIRQAGVTDLFGISERVPTFQVVQNTGPINTGFRVRRIGNEPNIPTFEPAVGLFVDQVYRSRSGLLAGDLFDIERIEILAGPQSTLYGKNTTAGVVQVLTRKPGDQFEAFVDLTSGVIEGANNAMVSRIETVVGGPLSETVSARLSGAWFDHEPILDNVFNGRDSGDMARFSVRGQLLLGPGPETEARLLVGHSRVNGAKAGDPDLDQGVLPALLNSQFNSPCPSPGARDRLVCFDQAGTYDLQETRAAVEVQHSLSGARWTWISAWEDYLSVREFDADQLNIPLLIGRNRQDGQSYSQEIRLASEGSPVRWMAGLFYLHSRYRGGDPEQATVTLGPAAALFRLPNGAGVGSPGTRGFQDTGSETRHLSAFAQGSWPLKNRFRLTAGFRWIHERKGAAIHNFAEPMTPSLVSIALLPPSANGEMSRNSSGVAWNLAGQFNHRENLLAYLSISRGFKSGGFNLGLGSAPVSAREFGDEKVTSFEFGARGKSPGHRVYWNAALFHAEYDNFQSAGWVSLRFQVNNAERVTVQGIEFDVEAVISDSLRGTASFSRANARYHRYTGGGCHYARFPDNTDGSGCDLSGQRLPLAPQWIVATGIQYRRDVQFGSWFAGAHWNWRSQYFTNATLDPRHVQSAHSKVDLRAGLLWSRFEFTAWVRNALDERVVMQEGPSNLFAGDPAYASFLALPRSWGLTLRATW